MTVPIDAYPAELKSAEIALIGKRRREDNPDFEKRPIVGFALSGGGIRSATFSLGVFQALSDLKLLREIDYLSTVSGGGYFGSFLGRLFTRTGTKYAGNVEHVLLEEPATPEAPEPPAARKTAEQPAAKTTEPPPWATKVIDWLRENGRYLAPNGAGDALLGAAAVMRNWVAIQTVMATLVLAILLAAQVVRGITKDFFPGCVDYVVPFLQHLPWGGVIWWSPYSVVAAVVLVVFVAPPLWSYWLVEGHLWGVKSITPILGFGLAVALSAAVLKGGRTEYHAPGISEVVLIISALTGISWLLAAIPAWTAGSGDSMARDELIRNLLTRQLKMGLIAISVVLAFVVVDSLGQSIYWVATSADHHHLETWAIAIFGPIMAFAGVIRKILPAAGSKSGGKRLGLPMSVLAGAAAIAVALIILVTLDVCAHGFAWGFSHPDRPLTVVANPVKLIDANQLSVTRGETKGTALITPTLPENKSDAPPVLPGQRHPRLLRIAFVVSALFSFLFGRSWPFLNRSSQKTIYASRLIRAYLGASNPKRLTNNEMPVTDVIEGDDFEQAGYWPLFARLVNGQASVSGAQDTTAAGDKTTVTCSYEKGAPLHLVNVTINETLDGHSQVEQHDRKGIGMAIGPAGISAGVDHHVVINDKSKDPPLDLPFMIYPKDGFRMFEYEKLSAVIAEKQAVVAGKEPPAVTGKEEAFAGEMLTLGNWTSISGAAVSTGLGARTSLGASFLLGFANARLGYWWDSGVDPQTRAKIQKTREEIQKIREEKQKVPNETEKASRGAPKARRGNPLGSWFSWILPVQSFLIDEFLARFHGCARRWWYLTDGGHFENMGGYELIRRRVPMIVVVDAEDDPDYTFEGIANLVRKARIDFGAEIDFLGDADLNLRVDESVRKFFGTPEQLRRGVWAKEPVPDPNVRGWEARPADRLSLRPPDESALSLAHAALADIHYPNHENGLLLYIKPTLTGDEPSDVRRYHSEHPSFPQETTAEQFFDEAQWESYRKLGEHIAEKIFKVPATNYSGKFVPHNLCDPRPKDENIDKAGNRQAG